ncbi:MAG: M48 family metallopeptidase [Deltaproteobacteria bacterium]|nr:M48 family metallopeptidase [Deltaproteobacteria bacterium]
MFIVKLTILVFLIIQCVLAFGCAGKQVDLVTAKYTSNDYPLEYDIGLGTLILERQKILSGDKIDSKRNQKNLAVLQEITQRLAKVSHYPQFPYEVHLVDADVNNAFCAPCGKIIVYEGLWNPSTGLVEQGNKAQLAAVLAHEIAHANARHGTEGLTRHDWINVWVSGLTGGIAGATAGTSYASWGQLLNSAISVTGEAIIPTYSRKDELEADQIGLMYMARAGYDPNEAVKLWEKATSAMHNDKKSVFATHPTDGTRASKLKEQMPSAMLYYNDSKKGTTPATYKLLANINPDIYDVKHDSCSFRYKQIALVDNKSYIATLMDHLKRKKSQTNDPIMKKELQNRIANLQKHGRITFYQINPNSIGDGKNEFYQYPADDIENPMYVEIQPSGEVFLSSAAVRPRHVCRGMLPKQFNSQTEKFLCTWDIDGRTPIKSLKRCEFSVLRRAAIDNNAKK